MQNPKLTTTNPVTRIIERKIAEKHIDLYANNAQVVLSYYDFHLSFGEILEASNEKLVTEDVVTIKMSPQLAKRLRDIIIEQVDKYEETYGLIPVPLAATKEINEE